MDKTVMISFSVDDFRSMMIDCFNSCLKHQPTPIRQSEQDEWFDLKGLCNYLPDKPAEPTVYSWVSKRLIPCHKRQKKLIFLKSEIDDWLKAGRKKTISEIQEEANNYLLTKKG